MDEHGWVTQVRRGAAWQGAAGMGKAGMAWRGTAWRGMERQGKAGAARIGSVRRGKDWLGKAGAGITTYGTSQGTHKAAQTAERQYSMSTKETKAKDGNSVEVQIKPPNFGYAGFAIKGTAPLVVNKFPQKARELMRAKQEAGSKGKKGQAREAKNFDLCFEQARHKSTDGWDGIPAAAFRAAMISSCRLVGFKMTLTKMAIFIEADGFDADEGTPLVRIVSKKGPEKLEMATRNETGVCDIRIRPMWREWSADVRVKYDRDIFSLNDVTNLLMRAGMQVGICEGRPDSKNSAGMGWGTFGIEQK